MRNCWSGRFFVFCRDTIGCISHVKINSFSKMFNWSWKGILTLLELSTTVVVNAIDNIGKLAAGIVDTDCKLHSLVRHGLRTSKWCLSGWKIIHEDGEQKVKVLIKNLFFLFFLFPKLSIWHVPANRARICKPFKETRNRFPARRPGKTNPIWRIEPEFLNL
jgi:hypothetical protein